MALNLVYQDKGTLIHRFDPRVKLFWLISVSVIITTWDDPLFLLGMLIVVLLYARIAGFGFGQILRSVLLGWPFILLLVVFNVFLWQPPSVNSAHLIGYIIQPKGWLPALPLYWETLVFSAGTVLRILVLVISIFTMMRTVSPTELALVITRMGIPTEIGMALSMAIAYIPAVMKQLSLMMEIQQSRALRMNSANPFSRFLAFIPIVLPTFFRSFQTAETMAAAMISRGFGYDMARRTELTATRYRRRDWTATLCIVAFLICSLIISTLGLAHYTTTIILFDHFFFRL